ncbi:MAG: HEPN domain-containing protein [Thermoguttaceae bacterium]|jgi:HEPN domain-containing protein
MKPITAEWVQKAEGDFAMMQRELRARKAPCYDGACFHAQQCAEKYLKARLAQAAIPFAKTHDLVALLEQVLPVEPKWDMYRNDLASLTAFAVAYRYPGDSADREDAKQAAGHCRRFRAAARKALRIKPA